LWSYDAGAPVLSVPGVGTVDGKELITFSAGERMITIDAARGTTQWSIDDRGFSSGQVAIDGGIVYSATADGYARAHDLATGEQRWALPMATGDPHGIALYSGWDDVVAAGDGIVVVATVSNGLAIDATAGTQRWKLSGSTMYAPSLIIGDAVLLTTENGVVSLVDAATGAIRWTTNLGLRVFNAGVVLQDDVAWVVSVDGKTIGVGLADGSKVGWLQHSLVYNFGRPVVIGNTLVVGDQNGIVRALRLP
jgi:outer membrane protein assembly factor BamB